MVTLTHSSSILGILGTGRGHHVLTSCFGQRPRWKFSHHPQPDLGMIQGLAGLSRNSWMSCPLIGTRTSVHSMLMEGTSPKWEKCLILFLLWFTITFVSIFWGSCHLLMRLFIVKCCVETLNAVPVALSYDYSFGCFCSLVYRVKPFFPVLICDVFTSIVAAFLGLQSGHV